MTLFKVQIIDFSICGFCVCSLVCLMEGQWTTATQLLPPLWHGKKPKPTSKSVGIAAATCLKATLPESEMPLECNPSGVTIDNSTTHLSPSENVYYQQPSGLSFRSQPWDCWLPVVYATSAVSLL